MEREPRRRRRLYLQEVQRHLDIRLEDHHSQEIYGGFCKDRASQRRKLEHALIAVRVPNDDKERG